MNLDAETEARDGMKGEGMDRRMGNEEEEGNSVREMS